MFVGKLRISFDKVVNHLNSDQNDRLDHTVKFGLPRVTKHGQPYMCTDAMMRARTPYIVLC